MIKGCAQANTSQSCLQWPKHATSAGFVIRDATAASIRFCVQTSSHISTHALQPLIKPWFWIRRIADCLRYSMRFSRS